MSWLILGAGICGKSLANYFTKKGDSYLIYDDKKGFSDPNNNYESCSSPEKGLKTALSLVGKKKVKVITSPGIPKEHSILKEARKKGCLITNEADFALEKIRSKVIAITGTNGKSTVASMCQHILIELGYTSKLLGNIGTPLSSLPLEEKHPDYVVVELSSYQLEQMTYNRFFCSIFTNFAEDHLERHKTMENYFLTKTKIFQTKTPKHSCGFWPENLDCLGERFGFWTPNIMPIKTVSEKEALPLLPQKLRWPKFNLQNAALSAKACTFATGESIQKTGAALSSFRTIPHRFESFARTKTTVFINDSKATNIDAAEAAFKNLDKPSIVLLGGLPKTTDFKTLSQWSKNVELIVAFGKSNKQIDEELSKDIPVLSFESLSQATSHLKKIVDTKKPNYLVLTPGCASFDEFNNFSERGSFFKKKIIEAFKEELI